MNINYRTLKFRLIGLGCMLCMVASLSAQKSNGLFLYTSKGCHGQEYFYKNNNHEINLKETTVETLSPPFNKQGKRIKQHPVSVKMDNKFQSLALKNVAKTSFIELYDSPDCSKTKAWTSVHIKEDVFHFCVKPGFEISSKRPNVQVKYHPMKGSLNGKVSCIKSNINIAK